MASAVESFKIEAQNYSDGLEIEVAERNEIEGVNDLLTSSIDYASKIKNFIASKHKLTEYCQDHFMS